MSSPPESSIKPKLIVAAQQGQVNFIILYNLIVMQETEIIFSVQESPEGGYEARALGYSIFTQGDSLEELREMVRDAVRCHFDEDSVPAIICLHFVKDEVLLA